MARKLPWPLALLSRLRFLRSSESALGDLLEEYNAGTASRRWLWRQALSLLWPGTRKSPDPYPQQENKMNLLASVWNDVRFAARSLRKNPGFTAVAVLAISLGIGVNTGIFTVLNGVALRPLPVPGSTEIVSVYQSTHGILNRNIDGAASFFSLAGIQNLSRQQPGPLRFDRLQTVSFNNARGRTAPAAFRTTHLLQLFRCFEGTAGIGAGVFRIRLCRATTRERWRF